MPTFAAPTRSSNRVCRFAIDSTTSFVATSSDRSGSGSGSGSGPGSGSGSGSGSGPGSGPGSGSGSGCGSGSASESVLPADLQLLSAHV